MHRGEAGETMAAQRWIANAAVALTCVVWAEGCSALLDFDKAPRPDAAADAPTDVATPTDTVSPRDAVMAADVVAPRDVVTVVDVVAPRDVVTPDVGCACAPGQVCAGGQCVAPCPHSGEVTCDGRCVDVRSDNHHCGACGVTCERPMPRCCNGACGMMCP